MLHTALAGRVGHASYAPCSEEDLRSKGYDYWALRHVHEFEIDSEAHHMVFPCNMQGRNILETGLKGAVLVTVVDGEVTAMERVELDVLGFRENRKNDSVPAVPRAHLRNVS